MKSSIQNNPVHKAVLQAKLRQAALDQKIALHFMTQGETCAGTMSFLVQQLYIVLLAAQMDGITGRDVNQLRGSLNACLQMLEADYYDTSQTAAVTRGIDISLELMPKLKTKSIDKAIAICISSKSNVPTQTQKPQSTQPRGLPASTSSPSTAA